MRYKVILAEVGRTRCQKIPPISRQGDQETTKVGKRISRPLSKVSATGFIQCGRGMLRQRLPEHAMPTLDGGCVKLVAETFERALDMRFPTFVVS